MIVTWITLTLLLAVLVGGVAAAFSDQYEKVGGFLFGFLFTAQVSGFVAVIYVAAHFIGKYW